MAYHWTMNDVASQIGMSRSAYADWEQGRHIPRDYARDALCDLFGLPPASLGFTEMRRLYGE